MGGSDDDLVNGVVKLAREDVACTNFSLLASCLGKPSDEKTRQKRKKLLDAMGVKVSMLS